MMAPKSTVIWGNQVKVQSFVEATKIREAFEDSLPTIDIDILSTCQIRHTRQTFTNHQCGEEPHQSRAHGI